jgi:CheY-like chemotaxis protein
MNRLLDSPTILVVDDDLGHCELVRRNLRRAGVSNEIRSVHDGKSALDFVFGQGAFAGHALRSDLLILLDINMPGGMSGLDVLQALKADAAARIIPVIMLTTTDDPRDIEKCYALGCSVYITKPVDPERFIEAVKRLGLLLSVIQVPHLAGLGGGHA